MSLDHLRSMPGHLIRRAQQVSSALFSEELRGSDLTSVQFAALTAIREHPGLLATDLSNLIAFDRATIGGVVERLEARELIRREPCTTDKRTKRLYVTAGGEAQLALQWEAVLRMQDRLLSPLSTSERETFMRLLSKLVEHHNPTTANAIRGEEAPTPKRS